MIDFTYEVNTTIFTDIFGELSRLATSNSPLRGIDAEYWDALMVIREQVAVQSIYDRYSKSSPLVLNEVQVFAVQRDALNDFLNPLPHFRGNIANISHRILYGMILVEQKRKAFRGEKQ